MTQYEKVALRTLKILKNSNDPNKAWDIAAKEIITSVESQKKQCPRNTFLSLCNMGLIIGVNKGEYTKSKKNKYILKALKILSDNNNPTPKQLWKEVLDENEKGKSHNSEMHVVKVLWDKNYINLDVLQELDKL